MCRQDQEEQERLYKDVVAADYTGLGLAKNSRVTEGSRSGLPHSHGLGWRKEVNPGPDSVSSLLGRLQRGEGNLTWEERSQVVELGQRAITVTTSVPVLRNQFDLLTQQEAEDIVTLARSHQVHVCSHHCSGSSHPGQLCGQYFPRLPSLLSLVAMRPALPTDDQKARLEDLENITERVQDLLRALPVQVDDVDPVTSLVTLLRQVAGPPVLLPGGGITWAGVVFSPGQELEYLLQECGAKATNMEDTLVLVAYHSSLLERRHAKFLPVRRVSEAWGVNYNPWVLRSTRSNVEVELVTHTPYVLQSYLAKGATAQTILQAAEEVDSRGGRRMGDMAEQLRQAQEEGWREVSLLEAFFRLDPGLHLATSNCHVEKINPKPHAPTVLLYTLR